MAKHIEDEVVYYYDLHPTEEDLMGESADHSALVRYLMEVLTWLFHIYPCAIYENLNFYQTAFYQEKPLAPDIAVIRGVEFQRVRSWRVGKHGPAPHVVFEIASLETWETDLAEKPTKYGRMGVQEYFAYDPNDPTVFKDKPGRLLGWRLDPNQQEMGELPLRADGSLWSVQLESFLVPDGPFLRLEDRYGQRRLTKAEAEEQRAEAAERRAEAEAKRAEALAEKLRSLGIDPNQL